MSHWKVRREIIGAARSMLRTGLTRGTAGNLSGRVLGGFIVTPTRLPYDELEPPDLVLLDHEGLAAPGQLRPSSEWRMHRDIYAARPEVGAVVHAHPPFATTIACLRRDLPAVHYSVAAAGGAAVRCAAYATFGTAELSRNALAALEGRAACLLANHGIVAVGADLSSALGITETVEAVAEVYWRALVAGSPVILDEAEMARVVERFRDYGQPRRSRRR